jgi:hypothetical protein
MMRPRAPMPTYKVIFRKPNGATRVVRVVAESPGAAQQKAGLPQNEESVEIIQEKYERAAFVTRVDAVVIPASPPTPCTRAGRRGNEQVA